MQFNSDNSSEIDYIDHRSPLQRLILSPNYWLRAYITMQNTSLKSPQLPRMLRTSRDVIRSLEVDSCAAGIFNDSQLLTHVYGKLRVVRFLAFDDEVGSHFDTLMQ